MSKREPRALDNNAHLDFNSRSISHMGVSCLDVSGAGLKENQSGPKDTQTCGICVCFLGAFLQPSHTKFMPMATKQWLNQLKKTQFSQKQKGVQPHEGVWSLLGFLRLWELVAFFALP